MQEQPAGKPSNFVLFLLLTFAVLMLHRWYVVTFVNPPAQAKAPVAGAKAEPERAPKPVPDKPKGDEPKAEQEAEKPGANEPEAQKPVEPKAEEEAEEEPQDQTPAAEGPMPPTAAEPAQYLTIGSADPADPYRMLVTLTPRGAAVARIELNSPRYPQLMDDDGYVGPEGYLAYTGGYLGRVAVNGQKKGGGCTVDVVGGGTPAAKAGLKPGDVITQVDGRDIRSPDDLHKILAKRKPGRQIQLTVVRDGKPLAAAVPVKLTRPPMEVVRPENGDPLSFLMTLSQVDKQRLGDMEVDANQPKDERPFYVEKEIPGLNLRNGDWEVAEHTTDRIEFRCKLPRWGLEMVKAYRLEPVPKDKQTQGDYRAYNLILDVSVRLVPDAKNARNVAYQLDGPTGLPIEGWWFASKVGRSGGAGLRDLIVSRNHQTPGMVGCITIARDKVQDYVVQTLEGQPITYIGVDAQYFSSVLIPRRAKDKPDEIWFDATQPLRVGRVDPKHENLTNVTCRMRSVTAELTPGGETLSHSFTVFAGPKRPEILTHYGLDQLIYYGWPIYEFTARPMAAILRFFHSLVGNYGIAILMLTVTVRLLMYPMSRKQALGAQKMAELQPEIKKIQEKYKKDMEGRTRAQQELFKKHKYNPLSGCLVMFVQLPIFIGLYRALMVNVELRGSPLLWPGLRWCSNLSAPDMLFDWSPFVHWLANNVTVLGLGGFFNNMLGPYFNLLPIVTVVLFLVQQKMFMPPPTDEQQKMQQNMMKYMMLFMGLLFFKVAAGLCVYFIASSAWSLAERKLLPKAPKKDDGPPPGDKLLAKLKPDPSERDAREARRNKSRRRK